MNQTVQNTFSRLPDGERLSAWTPRVIDGGLDHPLSGVDPEEVWSWYLARLRSLGGMSFDQARLWGTLNWTGAHLRQAVKSSHCDFSGISGTDDAMKSFENFKLGDAMARLILDTQSK